MDGIPLLIYIFYYISSIASINYPFFMKNKSDNYAIQIYMDEKVTFYQIGYSQLQCDIFMAHRY